MTSDEIVELLRASEGVLLGPNTYSSLLNKEAAARIEELERQLREARNAALEEAAEAVEKHDKEGREWAPASLRDELAKALEEVQAAMKSCEHDGGFDREIGPIGCDLGDKCVCAGVYPLATRAALSRIKESNNG